MSLDKFEGLTNRILRSENLQNLQSIRYNRSLIDQDLLVESQTFVSFGVQSVKPKVSRLESTEEIDARVKKINDVDERLKKFVKIGRKQFKEADEHCDLHRNMDRPEFSVFLNKFTEKDLPVADVDSVLKRDEVVIQQHTSNFEKVNKLMEAVKEYKYKFADLPAAQLVTDATTFLREVITNFE